SEQKQDQGEENRQTHLQSGFWLLGAEAETGKASQQLQQRIRLLEHRHMSTLVNDVNKASVRQHCLRQERIQRNYAVFTAGNPLYRAFQCFYNVRTVRTLYHGIVK